MSLCRKPFGGTGVCVSSPVGLFVPTRPGAFARMWPGWLAGPLSEGRAEGGLCVGPPHGLQSCRERVRSRAVVLWSDGPSDELPQTAHPPERPPAPFPTNLSHAAAGTQPQPHRSGHTSFPGSPALLPHPSSRSPRLDLFIGTEFPVSGLNGASWAPLGGRTGAPDLGQIQAPPLVGWVKEAVLKGG